MIQFTKRIELTKEEVLKHLSEYDILMGFWPASREVRWNRAILSPFRDEEHPSFVLSDRYERITYKDMGDSRYHGDVFTFVRQMENLADHDSVLRAIDKRFNLGLTSGKFNPRYKEGISWEQHKAPKSTPPRIQIVTRKFTQEELKYWERYYQGLEDLKREEIYVPKTIYRNGRKLPTTLMTFCYFYPEVEKWKIYRPFGEKGKDVLLSRRKWDTNLDYGYVEHIDKLRRADLGILTKSRKDRMVLRKALGIDNIAVCQAEDPATMDEQDIATLKSAEHPLVCFDNDKQGRQSLDWFFQEHGIQGISPAIQEHITDFADLAYYQGLDAVKPYFTNFQS